MVIGKKLTAHVSPKRDQRADQSWGLVAGGAAGRLAGLQLRLRRTDAADLGLLLFYAGAASMLTVWLWMTGLRRVPAARAGVFMVFLPVATAAVGLLLGEQMGLLQALAYGLALAGVVLATWNS